jgi:hypothetical protein
MHPTAALRFPRPSDNRYIKERMPERHTTSRGYLGKLKIIRAKWGTSVLPLSPSAVELWLKGAKKVNGELYSKKSRGHLKKHADDSP